MPIKFSEHAENQLKRRGISKKLVIKCIRNSQKSFVSFRGRKLRQINVGDTILEVVIKTEGSRITVITAYYI